VPRSRIWNLLLGTVPLSIVPQLGLLTGVARIAAAGENNHRLTESQNGQGWKGPLGIIKFNPPAKAGSPTAGGTRPSPIGF